MICHKRRFPDGIAGQVLFFLGTVLPLAMMTAALLVPSCAHAQAAHSALRFTRTSANATAACSSATAPCLRVNTSDGTLHFSNVGGGVADVALGGGVTSSLSYSLTGGATVTWSAAVSAASDFFLFDPNDGVGGVPWLMGFSANTNALGARNDNVMTLGWECSATGGDPLKGHLCMNFEDYWYDPILGDYQSEWYLAIGPPSAIGPGYRPIAINTSQTNPTLTKILVHAHDIQIGAGVGPSAGQTQIALVDGELDLLSPTQSVSLKVQDTGVTVSGPSNNSSGDQTLSLFDADPARPGIMARFGGGAVPQSDGTRDLGWYTDNVGLRLRWKRVVGMNGQFISQALSAPSYNDIGSISTLWDNDELTDAQPWIQLADVSSLGWFRLPTARALAADADQTPITSATTIAPKRPIVTVTGTTTVQTITVLATLSAGGIQTIIPTGALPFGTSGNIGAAFTAAANVPVIAVWDGVSKWWLR